jgi:hypothetical protein
MVAKQLRTVLDPLEVCAVASSCPDEGRDLPFRSGGDIHPAHTEARAELRDRETYYAELRFAVHCQSRSIPVPRAAQENESWDEMIARFDDTWT